MSTWLVAVDESEYADWAFNTAIALMNREDVLLIAHIAKAVDTASSVAVAPGFGYAAPLALEAVQRMRKTEEDRAKHVVTVFGRRAQALGVKCRLLIGFASHVGDALCQTVEEKNVVHLVMGRRSMSPVKRFFVGSTSKYCLEHADCNVVLVKKPYGPPEEHSKVSEVIAAEEEERKRRIHEDHGAKELPKEVIQLQDELHRTVEVATHIREDTLHTGDKVDVYKFH